MKTLVAGAVAAAALVAAAVTLVVLLARGGEVAAPLEDVPLEREFVPAIQAQTEVTPRAVLFGDTVQAIVDVTLDSRRVDPATVRYTANFDPWEPAGRPVTTRRDGKQTTFLQTTWTLRCLSSACPPRDAPVRTVFAPLTITYDRLLPAVESGRTMTRRFPALVTSTRLDAQSRAIPSFGSERFETPWRADLRNLPEPTYRAGATALRISLFSVAGALALAGLALAYLGRPRRRRVEPVAVEEAPPPPPPPAIEQALILLETQQGTDGARDRRRALELVALELAGSGAHELAELARRLAWSEEQPARERARSIAEQARPALGLDAVDEPEPEEEREVQRGDV